MAEHFCCFFFSSQPQCSTKSFETESKNKFNTMFKDYRHFLYRCTNTNYETARKQNGLKCVLHDRGTLTTLIGII